MLGALVSKPEVCGAEAADANVSVARAGKPMFPLPELSKPMRLCCQNSEPNPIWPSPVSPMPILLSAGVREPDCAVIVLAKPRLSSPKFPKPMLKTAQICQTDRIFRCLRRRCCALPRYWRCRLALPVACRCCSRRGSAMPTLRVLVSAAQVE